MTLDEIRADIALEIRVVMNHSDECEETFGRLPCVCGVEKAAQIVEQWRSVDEQRHA